MRPSDPAPARRGRRPRCAAWLPQADGQRPHLGQPEADVAFQRVSDRAVDLQRGARGAPRCMCAGDPCRGDITGGRGRVLAEGDGGRVEQRPGELHAISTSASACLTAWNDPIGLPNCSLVFACRMLASSSPRPAPSSERRAGERPVVDCPCRRRTRRPARRPALAPARPRTAAWPGRPTRACARACRARPCSPRPAAPVLPRPRPARTAAAAAGRTWRSAPRRQPAQPLACSSRATRRRRLRRRAGPRLRRTPSSRGTAATDSATGPGSG